MNTSSRLCFANETLYASPFDPLVDGATWRTLCTNHFSNISCALVSFAEWYSSFKNIVNHTIRYANQLHSITKSIGNKLDLENTSSQTLSLTNAACHRLLSSLIRTDFTWPNRVTYSLCPSLARTLAAVVECHGQCLIVARGRCPRKLSFALSRLVRELSGCTRQASQTSEEARPRFGAVARSYE